MSDKMQISVRRIAPLTNKEDAKRPGVYSIAFTPCVQALPLAKLASIALDVFHSSVSIGVLDDFEITVVHDGAVIDQDTNHEDYSGSDEGSVTKMSPTPLYLPTLDVGAAGHDLDQRYNPDGDGEHPEFTRDAWIEAVKQKSTLRGYWDWAAAQIEEHPAKANLS